MAALFGFLIRLGFGGIVDKAIGHIERRAELGNDRDRLKAETTVALAREAVKEAQIMADFNEAKLRIPWFWMLVAASLAPMLLWQGAVAVYSVFWCADCMFPRAWTIAALPSQLAETYSRATEWLFYVGTSVGALNLVRR